MLKKTFNCDAEQRTSLMPYTLSVIIFGLEVQNYSVVSDSEYVSIFIRAMNNIIVKWMFNT